MSDELTAYNEGLADGHVIGRRVGWNKVTDDLQSLPPNGRMVVGVYNVGSFAYTRIIERMDGINVPGIEKFCGWQIRFYTAIGAVERVLIPEYWIDLPDPNEYA